MNTNPKISVIMSVYNTPIEYLKESIDSILNQTYKDFEFIIINDNSNDLTTDFLSTYTDNRIRLFTNETNLGLTKSLNVALNNSIGKYIARMDSDDIALPNRLEEQLEYIENNPQYIAIGSSFKKSNSDKIIKKHNMSRETRRCRMLFYNEGLCHPTAFINNEILKKYDIKYDENILKAQDYALWVELLKYGNIGNIDKQLLIYRIHNNQITNNFSSQMKYEQMTIKKQLDKFNYHFDNKEIDLFYHIYRGEITDNENIALEFINKLIKLNDTKALYNQKTFIYEIKRVWLLGSLKQIKKHHRIAMLLNYFKITH